jgi:DNA repair exonuclease SbcCD nuclease subunit
MNYLLFSDPHFVDTDLESYRWNIFKVLTEQALKHKVDKIICLGDLVDTKDRHSGKLVNRLVDEFSDLRFTTKAENFILAGNHDKPLNGPYYWQFLNRAGVTYIDKPQIGWEEIVLLPFSSNAVEDWANINWSNYKVVFMHQTVAGAIVEDDRAIPSNPYPLPSLPDIPIFSGDVHRPQKIGNLTYVGAPHPVRFSETWSNRIILIQNDDFTHPIDIWVPGVRRAILDVELDCDYQLGFRGWKAGDQLKIRVKLKADNLTAYPEEENRIKEWAQKNGIYIASLEPLLTGDGLKVGEEVNQIDLMSDEDVIKTFAEQEKLSEDVVKMGYQILKESK